MKTLQISKLLYFLFLSCLISCLEDPEIEPISIEDTIVKTSTAPEENTAYSEIFIYGPMRFYSSQGTPETQTETFRLPPCYKDDVSLIITNGTGDDAVTSAVVKVNGEVIFSQSDFNKKVTELQAQSQLQPVNELEITIYGSPGTYFDLSFKGIALDGLVACYPFNGNAEDKSGFGNNGVVTGPTLTADRNGNTNSAFDFDGIDDYIEIMDDPSLNFTTSLSLVAWVKIGDNFNINGEYFIISKGREVPYTLGVRLNNFWAKFGTEDNANLRNFYSTTTLDQQWRFVVATYDGFMAKIYVDGQEENETGLTGDLLLDGNPLAIGREAIQQANYFPGSMDDIRIYSVALTGEEVLDLYEAERVQ